MNYDKKHVRLLDTMIMEKPDGKITEFIRKHHVLTLATVVNNKPWCSNCFYAYHEEENVVIFTSDDDTRHIKEVRINPLIAGSIVLETEIIGKIQGLQLEGKMFKSDDEADPKYKNRYLKRFPYAILTKTSIWVVELTLLKLTDNRLGFGKKIIWNKEIIS